MNARGGRAGIDRCPMYYPSLETPRQVMKSTTAIFSSIVFTLLLFAVPTSALAQAVPVQPKAMYQTAPVNAWVESFDVQMTQLLRSSNPKMQEDAMTTIIEVNHRYGDHVRVDRAVPELLEIARTADTIEQRQLAITTLYHTGDRSALRTLATRLRDEPSLRVRTHTRHVLAATFVSDS